MRLVRIPAPFGLGLVAALALAAGCSDDAPAPEPGSATFALRSPHGAEGGAVLLVTGQTVTTGDADDGRLFLRQVGEGTRVVVVRSAPGEIRFRLEVEDVHRLPDVEVEQVSGPDDALRTSLTGYDVEAEVEG